MSDVETLDKPRSLDFPATRQSPAGEYVVDVDTLLRPVFIVNLLEALPRKADQQTNKKLNTNPSITAALGQRLDVWNLNVQFVTTAAVGTRRLAIDRFGPPSGAGDRILWGANSAASTTSQIEISDLSGTAPPATTLQTIGRPIRLEPGWLIAFGDLNAIDGNDVVSYSWEYTERVAA